ncbi:aminopeptidase [bacterium]|nr:aminopeptidase [bacterium]
MDRSTAMAGAARDAMRHVLDLAPADRVLVVTDPESAACGDAFARGAREHGCTVRLHTLPAAGRPLTAVPDDLRVLLPDATVVVNTLVGDAAEVPFRLKWIQLIEGAGRIRLGHSPGIDPDMMVSGALGVDYARMAELARDLRAGLADAVSLHLSAPGGTDLRLDLTGRPWTDDLKATVDTGANLPCGEVYCAPLETGADGVVVCDGCFGAHGTVAAPVRIAVAGGRATDVACADADLAREVTALMDTDPGARTIAELGIGLNPGARLTERMLEAEKVRGTAHVAFGDNEGIGGGRSRSRMHVDYLVKAPTIVVTRADGSTVELMRDGQTPGS